MILDLSAAEGEVSKIINGWVRLFSNHDETKGYVGDLARRRTYSATLTKLDGGSLGVLGESSLASRDGHQIGLPMS